MHDGAAASAAEKKTAKVAATTKKQPADAKAAEAVTKAAAAAVTLDVSAPVPRPARQAGPGRVTPAELHHALQGGGGGGVVLLDVRPRHLYAAAALHGSVSVPLSELEVRAVHVELGRP
jgi:hypothetical protein